MRRILDSAMLMLVLLSVAGEECHAQSLEKARVAVTEPLRTGSIGSRDSLRPSPAGTIHDVVERLPLWSAPLASAVLPGLGQFRLGKDRSIAFFAVEAFLLIQFVKNNGEGDGSARNYRALARDIARRTFPGTHPDTIFEYYEAMGKNLESGSFSKTPTGPTIPETDPATYNGKQWILAREQYGLPLDDAGAFASPRYADALAYYEGRAVPQAYGWSWTNAQFEHDLFKSEIARSNDAYVRARRNLSAIIANHLLSSIDAFASVRLIQAAGGDLRLSASIPVR
jgi:hypothetical protein